MKHALGILALAVAALALGLHWIAARDAGRGPAPAESVDLAPLARRVEALEARGAASPERAGEVVLEAPEATRAQASEPADAAAGAQLEQRVAHLEASLASLQAQREAAPRSARRVPTPAEIAAAIERASAQARDLAASEAQRLEGLRALRGATDAAGADARLAVLDEMIRMAQASTDGDTRADVWRQMSHVTDARLKRPLLDALAFDPHEKAREEAAETLEDFLPDAQVESALRAAAQNDASASVRRQAASSLAGS